jgi:hypothetical protein
MHVSIVYYSDLYTKYCFLRTLSCNTITNDLDYCTYSIYYSYFTFFIKINI